MRVDFYQLSRDPVEQVVPLLARKVMQAGERLVVVSSDEAQRKAISDALWEQGGASFLANGEAGSPHAERQPILLSGGCDAPNGARMILVADGQWREEAAAFTRALLLFGAQDIDAARSLWRSLGQSPDHDLHIFKQGQGGDWREGR